MSDVEDSRPFISANDGVYVESVECPVCGEADFGCLLGMHWRPAYEPQDGAR